jgi:dolichyl-phosphate-mannose-protein mannosyltransferase
LKTQFAMPAGVNARQAEAKSAPDTIASGFAQPHKLRRLVLSSAGILAVAVAFFLAGISNPARPYYDENQYISAARAFLANAPNPNPEAPPLGKLLIAVGIKAVGDTPLGWRIAGAVCGSLTLVAIFCSSFLLSGNERTAWLATALTLLNNFLFVMSRVAMMDVFLVCFLLWGLVAYTAAVELDVAVMKRRVLVCLAGAALGLAAACKWNAVDTLAVLLLGSLVLFWSSRRAVLSNSSSIARYSANLRRIGWPTLVSALLAVPVIFYSLTFWPLCRSLRVPFSAAQLISMNVYMWRFHVEILGNKFIALPWYAWPFNLGPQRALSYLLGNPIVMWAGLVALVFCLMRFWKFRAAPEGLVALLYLANLLQWAVTPAKSTFYYYYFPAAMVLGVAVALALQNLPRKIAGIRVSLLILIAAAIVFLWCYPRMAHLDAPWDCALGCWS